MIESSIAFLSGDEMDKNPTVNSIRVTNVGYAKLYNIKQTIRRNEDIYHVYLLFYIKNGKMEVKSNGKTEYVYSDYIYILDPKEKYEYTFYDDEINEHYYFYLTGSDIENIFKDLNILASIPIYVGEISDIDNIYKRMLKNLKTNNFKYSYINASYISYILSIASTNYNKLELKKETKVDKALELFEKKYNTNITIDECAKACNLNKYYFIRIFKEITGKTPNVYLVDERIRISKILLSTTKLSISEISDHVGFQNPLYFSNTFKKKTGLSPKEYRIRIK